MPLRSRLASWLIARSSAALPRSGVAPEIAEMADEHLPVPDGAVAGEPLGRAHVEDGVDRLTETLLQHPRGEPGRLMALGLGETIRLAQDKDQGLDLARHLLDERKLLSRDRRIGPQHHERGVDVGDEGAGGAGGTGEYRAHARRIHQTHAGLQELRRHEHLDGLDSFLVVRVLLLGDVGGERLERNGLPGARGEAHAGAALGPVADDRHHGGDGDDAGRQERLADQGVEKGGLAALELADAGHVEASPGDALGDPLRLRGQ